MEQITEGSFIVERRKKEWVKNFEVKKKRKKLEEIVQVKKKLKG